MMQVLAAPVCHAKNLRVNQVTHFHGKLDAAALW